MQQTAEAAGFPACENRGATWRSALFLAGLKGQLIFAAVIAVYWVLYRLFVR